MIVEVVETGYEESSEAGPLFVCCYWFWISANPA
jgi:hypothetical protein